MDLSVFRSSITEGQVEAAYAQARRAQERPGNAFTSVGLRAARSRDARLFAALERMAEVTLKVQEKQRGRTMRSPDTPWSQTHDATEHQMCREALVTAERGTPEPALGYIYGAAAWLCGYNL
jgi:hypothetical protein